MTSTAIKDVIPVPTNVSEITPEWISQILKTKISPEDFILQTDIQSGSGFLSKMSRLNCKSEDGQKSFALVIKLLPEGESFRSLVLSEKFDETEIQFYEMAMPELVEVLPKLEDYLCRSFYGRVQRENKDIGQMYSSVLVMEDLKPLGYYTINFAGQANSAQLEEVVQFLGKFHFAGMALEDKKGKPLNAVYDFLQGGENDGSSMFYQMARNGYGNVEKLLKSHGTSQDIIKSLNKLAAVSDSVISVVDAATKLQPCLIHGDLWSNNLLFNSNQEMHTKVIDWQLLGYKDPAIDLACTIFSMVSIEDLQSKEGRILELIHIYWNTFTSECIKAGKEHLIKRDFGAFKTYFYTWGMSYMMLWCLMDTEPFSANFPKLVKIYELILGQGDVANFLLSHIQA